jgi:hypothetical protein
LNAPHALATTTPQLQLHIGTSFQRGYLPWNLANPGLDCVSLRRSLVRRDGARSALSHPIVARLVT